MIEKRGFAPTAVLALQYLAEAGPRTATQIGREKGVSVAAARAGLLALEQAGLVENCRPVDWPATDMSQPFQVTGWGVRLLPDVVAGDGPVHRRWCTVCRQFIEGDNLFVTRTGRRRCATCYARKRTSVRIPEPATVTVAGEAAASVAVAERPAPGSKAHLEHIAASYRACRQFGRRAVPTIADEEGVTHRQVLSWLQQCRRRGILPNRGW